MSCPIGLCDLRSPGPATFFVIRLTAGQREYTLRQAKNVKAVFLFLEADASLGTTQN